jgi:hypothetical protein
MQFHVTAIVKPNILDRSFIVPSARFQWKSRSSEWYCSSILWRSGSKLFQENDHNSLVCPAFPHSLQENCGVVPQIGYFFIPA